MEELEEKNNIIDDTTVVEETNNNTVEKKETSKLKKIINSILYKEDNIFNAKKAWIETTYGVGLYKDIQKRISNKQNYIKDSIRTKFSKNNTLNSEMPYISYHCVVDIEEDLIAYTKEIFKPFIDGGYDIINLSDKIKELKDDNVYMISWKNAFKE